MDKNFFGKSGFVWWKGVVEDRKDPIFLGRVRVRIFGWHTDDKTQLPTEDLPWAMPSLPIDNGRNPVGLKEGDWCWGFFLDGNDAQKPVVIGYIPGIDEDAADPAKGFYDPTPDSVLSAGEVPRPPEMLPVAQTPEQSGDGVVTPTGRFSNTERLPSSNIAFGVLVKDYDPANFKFDLNQDGVFDDADVEQILDSSGDVFTGVVNTTVRPTVDVSRYPLTNRLMEPSTSRLSRNEKIEETIVALKKGDVSVGEGGGYENGGLGDSDSPPASFIEPETPYAAVYPYNHVYESESGHVIEVDDTPGKERLHWYHRSGTFKEIHPDGTEVNKVRQSQYNFAYGSYNNAATLDMNIEAGQAFRAKSGTAFNIKAGSDHNRQVGGSLNANVGGGATTKIAGESTTAIGKNAIVVIDGSLHIKVKESINIFAEGPIELTSASSIIMNSPSFVYTPLTVPSSENMAEMMEVKAASDGSVKYGFALPKGTVGDVWKPISDSNGNLVTLSSAGDSHELREAIPTGELEAVMIKYENPDGSTTTWEVVRPKHVPGDLIDSPVSSMLFEDGVRFLNRWSKPGSEYPKQLFWIVNGGAENLILDSAERHQCLTGPFDDQIPFNFREAGANTASGGDDGGL